MPRKIKVHSRKKPTKSKKWMNKPYYEDKIKVIHNEIDNWANTTGKVDLLESSLILNIIFSVPGGASLITLGAFCTDSLIFYGGVILLLQGVIVFPLLIVFPIITRNSVSMKIH